MGAYQRKYRITGDFDIHGWIHKVQQGSTVYPITWITLGVFNTMEDAQLFLAKRLLQGE